MAARSSDARYSGAMRRADVEALTRSRDAAIKAAEKWRVAKNVAMAAKRSAEKAAKQERERAGQEKSRADDAERLRVLATLATEAANAARLRSEAAELAVTKDLEAQKQHHQSLMERYSRVAADKTKMDRKYRDLLKQVSLKARRETPVSRILPLDKRVVADGMRRDQRQRELDVLERLTKGNANLRKQVGEREVESLCASEFLKGIFLSGKANGRMYVFGVFLFFYCRVASSDLLPLPFPRCSLPPQTKRQADRVVELSARLKKSNAEFLAESQKPSAERTAFEMVQDNLRPVEAKGPLEVIPE